MPRVAAWACLRSGNPAPLREVDRAAAERELDARDRALVRQLVGSELRHRGTLRALVRAFTKKQPKPDLTAHLHLGLVQLLYLDRVPDHAAVSTTVAAAAETLGPSKGPLMNGVLRNVIRARREDRQDDPCRDLVDRELSFDRDVFRDPVDHPHLWAEDALSIPAALMKRWASRLGRGRAMELARFFLTEPPLALRLVGQPDDPEAAREAMREELSAAGVETQPGGHPASLRAPADATGAVTASAAFTEGRITIQGESALFAADALEARTEERVLDLCAAPGGKTMRLLEAGARVTACDVDPERLERVRESAARLHLGDGTLTLCASDGIGGLAGADRKPYDAVFVDAPCSNTGVLGARPAARWRFGPTSLKSLTELQARLLREGASLLRPGGRLVWSTCSLEPEENGQLVKAFLDAEPGWELQHEETRYPGPDGPTDGGYVARLARGGAS